MNSLLILIEQISDRAKVKASYASQAMIWGNDCNVDFALYTVVVVVVVDIVNTSS